MRTVVNAAADVFGFTLDSELARPRTRGDHDGFCQKRFGCGFNLFDRTRQIERLDLGVFRYRAEALRARLHLRSELPTGDTLGKARVIVYRVGDRHLTARRHFFYNDDVKPRARRIKRRRVPSRPAADDYHIVNVFHFDSRFLLLWYYYNTIREKLSVMNSQKEQSFRPPFSKGGGFLRQRLKSRSAEGENPLVLRNVGAPPTFRKE